MSTSVFVVSSERQERYLEQLVMLRRAMHAREPDFRWIVVSSCTVVEAAYAELVDSLTNTYVKNADKFLLARVNESRRRTTNSWYTRLQWIEEMGGSVSPDLRKKILILADVRNAIAHSSSRFTDRQIESYEQFIKMRQDARDLVGLEALGVTFLVTQKTADSSLRISREAILKMPQG